MVNMMGNWRDFWAKSNCPFVLVLDAKQPCFEFPQISIWIINDNNIGYKLFGSWRRHALRVREREKRKLWLSVYVIVTKTSRWRNSIEQIRVERMENTSGKTSTFSRWFHLMINCYHTCIHNLYMVDWLTDWLQEHFGVGCPASPVCHQGNTTVQCHCEYSASAKPDWPVYVTCTHVYTRVQSTAAHAHVQFSFCK